MDLSHNLGAASVFNICDYYLVRDPILIWLTVDAVLILSATDVSASIVRS